MASSALNIGTLRAVLTADSAQWKAGFRTAASEQEKFTQKSTQLSKSLASENAKASKSMIAAMSEAGKANTASAKMIAGMSAAGRQAAAEHKAAGDAARQYAQQITGVGPAARKAADGLAQVSPAAKVFRSAMDSARGSFVQFVAGFSIGNIVTNVLNNIAMQIATIVSNGAKLSQVSQSFDRLTVSIGQSGAAMLDAMRVGSKGLIENLDLIQSANKAILLGLPVTADEMGKLTRTATALGRAMGQDATKSLDDLITALGRSSPLILDNLGLTVKLGEANEAYAAKLGRTADELTDAERKMAFYNAAMAAADKKVKELGEIHLTASDQIARLGVQLKNNLTETARNANESDVLTKSIGLLADAYERASNNVAFFNEVNRRRVASRGRDDIRSPEELKLLQETERQIEELKKTLKSPLSGGQVLPTITPTPEEVARLDSYVFRLGLIKQQLSSLKPEVRENIKAAIDLGIADKEVETRYHLISGALDVFKDQLAKAKSSQSDANQAMKESVRAAKEAADAYRKYQEAVADVVNEMHKLAVENANAMNERAAAQAESAADQMLASFNRRKEAERKAADTSKNIEEERAEFEIEQAKRVGASWQQIYAMEKALSEARLKRAIEQADAEFRARSVLLGGASQWTTPEELEALQREHDAAIQEMLEKHQHAEILKREELKKTHSAWSHFLESVKGMAFRLTDAITDNLVDALFSFDKHEDEKKRLQENVDDARKHYEELTAASEKAAGKVAAAQQKMLAAQKAFDDARARHAPFEELQRLSGLAVQARMAYEGIANGGKDSAKEIQEAFDKMREAEEEANDKFLSRWGQFWQGMNQTFTSILKDMLSFFTRSFIGGLIKSIAGARLGGLLGGALGGGGSIAGALAGGGGLASGAAINATTAGLSGGGGAAAGGAAGGGSGALAAFFTNPFTIGAAAAAVLGLAIWKKGLFRGGEEALKVSPRRDKFFSQFGDVQNRGTGGAAWNLASLMVQKGAGDGGGPMFAALQKADTVKEWESAEAAVVSFLGKAGVKVQSFMFGGLVRGFGAMPAILHGGEGVLSHVGMQNVGGPEGLKALNTNGAPSPKIVNVHIEVKSWDSVDTARWFRADGIRQIKQAIVLNTGGLGQAVGEAG